MSRKESGSEMADEDLKMVVEELKSRAEITEVLHRYVRGFDRFDAQEARACFFPDSTLEFDQFNGSAYDFIDAGLESIKDFKSVTHHITNISILIQGDKAVTECYYLAHQRKPVGDGEEEDVFLMGRYVDEFCKREGGWKIKHRIGLQDCLRTFYPADKTYDSVPEHYVSQRAPKDPFYLLKSKLEL